MESFYTTKEEPLAPHELKKLQKSVRLILVVLIFIALFFTLMFNMVEIEGPAFYPFAGFVAVFAIVILLIVRGYLLDLRDKTKEVFTGVITRKVRRRRKKRKGRGSSTSYYFYFGDKSMSVPLHLFGKFEEADMIEIHRSKRVTHLIYDSRLLKRGVLLDQVQEVKEKQVAKEQKMALIVFISFIVIVVLTVLAFNLGVLG